MLVTLNHGPEKELRRRPDGDVVPTSCARPSDRRATKVDPSDSVTDVEVSRDPHSPLARHVHGHANAPKEVTAVVRTSEHLVGTEVVERRWATLHDPIQEPVERIAGEHEIERSRLA